METDPARAIDLALEPAFSLGELEVRPATLEVVHAGGREQLEPRIMQVLVALARRRGEVVSRDELIATCWDGRVVGDDAINRCPARLRKLAETLGGFDIETIPRVGFRLTEQGVGASRRSSARARARLLALGLAAVVLLAIAAGGWWWVSGRRVLATPIPEPRLAVRPFEATGEGAAMAARLSEHVRDVLAENVAGLALSGGSAVAASGADMAIAGSVRTEGGLWRVRVRLEDVRSGIVLWTGEYERAAGDEDAFADAIAAAITETIYTAIEPREEGLRPDPRTLALYLKASEAQKSSGTARPGIARRAFEEVVKREPRFARARSFLALALVYESSLAAAPERDALRARARQEASRAQRTDTEHSAAFDAFYFLSRLEAPQDIGSAEAILIEGMRRASEYPFTVMRECMLLREVGRAHDALRYCERALALRPMAAAPNYYHLIVVESVATPDNARRAIARAARLFPNHQQTRRTRLEFTAFGDAPDEGLRLLRDPRTRPQAFDADTVAALEAVIEARRPGGAAGADRALGLLRAGVDAGRTDPRYLVLGAASLGRLDEAFAAAAARPCPVAETTSPGCLFEPGTEPMRRDPRFMKLAAQVGLVRYWRTSGQWPDFCRDPSLPYDCRKEAAKYPS